MKTSVILQLTYNHIFESLKARSIYARANRKLAVFTGQLNMPACTLMHQNFLAAPARSDLPVRNIIFVDQALIDDDQMEKPANPTSWDFMTSGFDLAFFDAR